jgi:hypothetical protein
MNLKNIINETINNGGCSYNITTGDANPTHGYMVAIHGAERSMPAQDLSQQVISDYIFDNALILADPVAFLGTWVNPENNMVYLDVSYLIDDAQEATLVGRWNKQIAIYDNNNKTTIYI